MLSVDHSYVEYQNYNQFSMKTINYQPEAPQKERINKTLSVCWHHPKEYQYLKNRPSLLEKLLSTCYY